ncbi:hypothetical protein [Salinibaculum rarum]|uniref:hypothetical protein n=1 Tax=Salinibaculum rarum TaxID=3058903 RepID=UPI00265F7145|nr:hypothetical protein [Salinibaculum sp. KK48]
MAERALLARERSDGSYAAATSRWGGTDRTLAAVCSGTPPTAVPDHSWEPRGNWPDFLSVGASLDPLTTELLYRVTDDETTPFLSLWFGLPLASASVNPAVGALVAVDSLPDARGLRRWFRRVKGSLADAVSAGTVPAATAPLVLVAAVTGLTGRERYLVAPDAAEPLYTNAGPDGP